MKKNLFSYIVSVLLLVFVFFYIPDPYWHILSNIEGTHLFLSVFFALILYAISGWQYYLVRKNFNLLLTAKDIILLPITMNLWSFVFPFQGSLVFTSIYFKKKYHLPISENFSIYIYLYLMTLFLTGMLGIIFFITHDFNYRLLGIISALFILHPLLIKPFYLCIEKISPPKNKFFVLLWDSLHKVINGLYLLTKDIRLFLLLFFLNILKIFVYSVWYLSIAQFLHMEINVFHALFLSLLGNILLIVKFTPDNLGVSQLLSGAVFGYLGAKPEDAMMITLYASTTTVFLIFTIGIVANFYYTHSLNIFSLYKKNVNDQVQRNAN